MSMKYIELIEIIEKIAPPFLMEEWDNSGIQIKVSNKKIEKILVALELNDEVIQEAIINQVDFIITHHPLLFNKIDKLSIDEVPGKYIYELIIHGISVYSAHTTFDKAMGGNNDCLINLIKLDVLSEVGRGSFEEFGIGRMAKLKKPVHLDAVVEAVAKGLGISETEMRKVGDGKRTIKKIGVCTGSGASLIDDALLNGCDVLITGDVKYHDAQHAREIGLCLIDAGHYYTERIFSQNFAEKLVKLLGEKTMIFVSQIDLNPFGN